MALAFSNYYWSPFVLRPPQDYEQSLEVISSRNLQRGQKQKVQLRLVTGVKPLTQPLLARLGEITSKEIFWDGKEVQVEFNLPADFSLGEQSICIVFPAQGEELCQIFRAENCVTIIDTQEVLHETRP
jgi:hypothetical protein